ncbi:MAG: ATP-dependent Clp protease adaptor ClpS [Spirochaetes bacterium GWF1_51_8]|nr:MAG: ATP-dependent Clp protease adaptor ClpS [Spirochaetes bacterium GWF1_51_8]
MPKNTAHPGISEAIKSGSRTQEPPLFRVIMHNDHYTTMEFVVIVLKEVFAMTEQKANIVMIEIHKKGSGFCGVFTFDVALTKIARVHELARENGFPLRCSFEPA